MEAAKKLIYHFTVMRDFKTLSFEQFSHRVSEHRPVKTLTESDLGRRQTSCVFFLLITCVQSFKPTCLLLKS